MTALPSTYLPGMASQATAVALEAGALPGAEWAAVSGFPGLEWQAVGYLWIFRMTPGTQASSKPGRMVAINPEHCAYTVAQPSRIPRDPLPDRLPVSMLPIGWKYVRILLRRLSPCILAKFGHPACVVHARATRNGRSDRPGRKRTYAIPVADRLGRVVHLTYTPRLGTHGPVASLRWPGQATEEAPFYPGSWQYALQEAVFRGA